MYRNLQCSNSISSIEHTVLPTSTTDLIQLKVRRSDIVTPFRQTVHLVNAGKSNPRWPRCQTCRQNSTHHCFGRKQEDINPTLGQASKDVPPLFVGLVSVDAGSTQARRKATYLHQPHTKSYNNSLSLHLYIIQFSAKVIFTYNNFCTDKTGWKYFYTQNYIQVEYFRMISI